MVTVLGAAVGSFESLRASAIDSPPGSRRESPCRIAATVEHEWGGPDMALDLAAFLRSLTAASGLRIAMALALTTGSVLIAYRERAGAALLVGCNAFALLGALYVEYRNFKARR